MVNNRNINYILATQLEPKLNLKSEIAELRNKFFSSENQKQKLKIKSFEHGYKTKVKGTISAKRFKFKKTVNRIKVEKVQKIGKNYVLSCYDLNGVLSRKIHYDNDMAWAQTEYFFSENFLKPSHILKMGEGVNAIEYLVYDEDIEDYQQEKLSQINMSDEQLRLIENEIGQAKVYVSCQNKVVAYFDSETMILVRKKLKSKPENLEEEISF